MYKAVQVKSQNAWKSDKNYLLSSCFSLRKKQQQPSLSTLDGTVPSINPRVNAGHKVWRRKKHCWSTHDPGQKNAKTFSAAAIRNDLFGWDPYFRTSDKVLKGFRGKIEQCIKSKSFPAHSGKLKQALWIRSWDLGKHRPFNYNWNQIRGNYGQNIYYSVSKT